MYPWQSETNMHLPGGAISVAHQFLRCVLHQLAPNGIFMQMFQTHLNGIAYKSIIFIRYYNCYIHLQNLHECSSSKVLHKL